MAPMLPLALTQLEALSAILNSYAATSTLPECLVEFKAGIEWLIAEYYEQERIDQIKRKAQWN